jgi:hypothetical protein
MHLIKSECLTGSHYMFYYSRKQKSLSSDRHRNDRNIGIESIAHSCHAHNFPHERPVKTPSRALSSSAGHLGAANFTLPDPISFRSKLKGNSTSAHQRCVLRASDIASIRERRHFRAVRLLLCRNNNTAIGILGRVYINIQAAYSRKYRSTFEKTN